DCSTGLPGVVESAPDRSFHCLVNMGIVHNDHGIRTPQFECQLFWVGRGECPYLPTGLAVAGKRDLPHQRVPDEGFPDCLSPPGNDVEYSRRKTAFLKDPCQGEVCEGG